MVLLLVVLLLVAADDICNEIQFCPPVLKLGHAEIFKKGTVIVSTHINIVCDVSDEESITINEFDF